MSKCIEIRHSLAVVVVVVCAAGLVREGQGEGVAEHRHQVDAAVLRLARPVLDEFGDQWSGAHHPLQDQLQRRVGVQDALVAQVAPLHAVALQKKKNRNVKRIKKTEKTPRRGFCFDCRCACESREKR